MTKQFIVGHDVARGKEITTVSEHDDHVGDAAEDEEECHQEQNVGTVGEFAEGPPTWLCGFGVVDVDASWFRHFFMNIVYF